MGCGYFSAGTWEDDSDNWGRAFGSRKPDDVRVIHSLYWRSPHFTLEFEYFFHIAANQELQDQLLRENDMIRVADVSRFVPDHSRLRPDWFLPRPIENYDTWRFRDATWSTFVLFIDRDTGDIFMHDRQV
jgi:hypothetical protein